MHTCAAFLSGIKKRLLGIKTERPQVKTYFVHPNYSLEVFVFKPFINFLLIYFLRRGPTHSIEQAGLEIMVLLPQPSNAMIIDKILYKHRFYC